ncbi:MAG TPA: 16S rRNA (cytosine(967)-C(5))-methyltransferase RsmB [Thermoleophilaceae bacterium]|jgi:16S rRNA (cytosine967-C5)-methyltransferase
MPASPARVVAQRVLERVFREGAWADRAFRGEAERAGLDPRERAFAQALAYGAVQRVRTLDHVLERCSSRTLDEVQPDVRDALRLGVLQVVWLDGVPDRAAVDQTVELVKAAVPRAGGFANAVMRRAAREARGIVDGLPEGTASEAALKHSHPDWLARMWWKQLGADEARALMARDNEPAESALRANTLRAAPEEVRAELERAGAEARPAEPLGAGAEPAPVAGALPEGIVVAGAFDAHASDLFARGLVMPQSRGSMLVARTLAPQPGERVLDMCAAPGAKSTHLAALMGNEGEVVAVESNEQRAGELRANAARLGATIVHVRTQDAREPVEPGGFDRVLLDAPCSDLGTLQSRPDARWRKGPAAIEELAELQQELLDAALAQLRPGGRLVYSTCTISPREQVGSLPGMRAEPPIQALPHRHGTDGFFIAGFTSA